MIFAPVRLGETSLNAEAVAADKKSCKRFGLRRGERGAVFE